MKNITIKSLRKKQGDAAKITEDFFSKPKNKTKELEEEQYRPTKTKKVINFIVLLIFVLITGGVGGILIDRFALPYLFVKYPDLNQYEFLKPINERTTVVEVIREIKISEEKAIVEAIKKSRSSIVLGKVYLQIRKTPTISNASPKLLIILKVSMSVTLSA